MTRPPLQSREGIGKLRLMSVPARPSEPGSHAGSVCTDYCHSLKDPMRLYSYPILQ